ncbi:sensor histidine kinase, partial [Rhizobium sp. RAF56]
ATTIALALDERHGNVVLTVEDNGPGIPAAEHEKVFRRLYRLDKSRTTSGAGLGLSLVKAVTELHAGRITVGDNNPGLKVTVELPSTPRGNAAG